MSTEGTDAREMEEKGAALSSSLNGNIDSESDQEANSGENQPKTEPDSGSGSDSDSDFAATPTSSDEPIPAGLVAAPPGISQSQNANVPKYLLQMNNMGILGLNNGGSGMDRCDDHLQGAGNGILPLPLPPPQPYPNWHLRYPTAASGFHAPQEIQFQGVLGRPGGEPSNQFPHPTTQQGRMNMQNHNGWRAELEVVSNGIRPALPLGNSCYSPIYEELGLPVDPHLRMFLSMPEVDKDKNLD